MKKTKLLLSLSTGIIACTTIPSICTSCNESTNHTNVQRIDLYKTNIVVKEEAEQIKSCFNQLIDLFTKAFESEKSNVPFLKSSFVEQKLNELKSELSFDLYSLLIEISKQCPVYTERKDPVDILQEILGLFKDKITNFTNKILDNWFVTFIFGQDKVQQAKDDIKGILNNEINLRRYAKTNLSLQKIFEKTLYKLIGREATWSLLWSVYNETYCIGINYSHQTGLQYDADINDIAIPEETTYNNIELYKEKILPGDIMFSGKGFHIGEYFTGHCGIVVGFFTDPNGKEYLRTIEPNQFGVSYNLVDDYRMSYDLVSFLHVKDVTEKQRLSALQFCYEQLGKAYFMPFLISEGIDADEDAWYCSEMVWASYMNQGINIQDENYLGFDMPGILPKEIYHCSAVEDVLNYEQI